MSTDERTELLHDFSTTCYTYIRFSGLYVHLTGEEWDKLAEEHAEQVLGLLEQLTNQRLTQIESEKEAMERWLSK